MERQVREGGGEEGVGVDGDAGLSVHLAIYLHISTHILSLSIYLSIYLYLDGTTSA